jgi:hypothetical protein
MNMNVKGARTYIQAHHQACINTEPCAWMHAYMGLGNSDPNLVVVHMHAFET